MTAENAVKLIHAQEGSQVILGLRRKGEVVTVPLNRARIEIHSVDSWLNTAADGKKIGCNRLKQFKVNTAREMRDPIRELESQGAQ